MVTSYLIVLNDLNTIEEWDRIKTCFWPDNKKGSRIIVSTKQAEVATLSVGYESAELKLKELAADQILYAFHNNKVIFKNFTNDSISKSNVSSSCFCILSLNIYI
jgi:hypothetical protein